MKNTTISKIFLAVGIIWFLISVKGWFWILYYAQNPNEPVKDYFGNPMQFDSLSEAQGYLIGEIASPLLIIVPAIIYFIIIKRRNKITKELK